MEKEEEEQTQQPMLQVSPVWKLIILGIILLALIGIGMMLFKNADSPVKRTRRGGNVHVSRWGARGGCGCSGPPMP